MKPQLFISPFHSISRRRFLKMLGTAGIAGLIAACQPGRVTPAPSATQTSTLLPPSPIAPLIPSATAVPFTPTPAAPTSSPTPAWMALVAPGMGASYVARPLKEALAHMLDGLGGLGSLVKSGARVGIKANLTGGTWWDTPDKPPATEFFVTHPAVVGALGELLKDAGASHITIMDGLGDETSFNKWGYSAIARPLGAILVNLCNPDPYPAFIRFPVGPQARIYQEFYLNRVLSELDVFISVAKMKCHSTTGVTLALKNLIGLAAISEYRLSKADNNRSAFHGDVKFDRRLPRVVIDLNLARPVHLAVIDGIFTAEAGAGPWDAGLSQVKPGLLVASRDPVAADAVAAYLMGFDPAAPSGQFPFVHGENHLALAAESGLGMLDLKQTGISGPPLAEISYKFKPVP